MKLHFKLRQWLIPWIFGLLLGLQYDHPTRAYMILLVALGGMLMISFFWVLFLGLGIRLQRESPANLVQAGNRIEESLTLSNTSLIPAPYVELIDHSTLPDFDASCVTSIDARASDEWTVPVFCKRRGLFHFGDAQVMTSDLLGIFEVTIHAPQRTPILVLPRPAALPEMSIAPSGTLGDGQPQRNASQQSMHASTVREFAEGDSMRLIHWPTTARREKTFVRQLESAPEGKWWIVLDLDQAYMLGSDWDSIEEQSIALAASLADLGLRNRKPVGLVSNGREFKWLPPQKGDAQLREILRALALAKPGALSLANVLDKMSAPFGNQQSLLIITACTQVDWMQTLPFLIKRGLIPTVFLMDTTSFEGGASMEIPATTLAKQRIHHHIIPCGLIEPPRERESISPIPWMQDAESANRHAAPVEH